MRLDKGLIHVYTGEGKGKTSAGMTIAMRAAQHGYTVSIIQFIKEIRSSEQAAFEERFPEVEFLTLGEGFYKILNDRKPEAVHRAAAAEAFKIAQAKVASGKFDVIILDEIHNAVEYGFISLKDILAMIRTKPKHVEIVLTGRNARPELVKVADYVSRIEKVKHPYDKGVLARKGIDF